MVKIVIENLGKKEVVINDLSKTVLQHLHGNFIDWMHACGAKGRCTTCKMIVLEGADHTSTLTVAESGYRARGFLAESERLACQTRIFGDILIRVPNEYKLPHATYTD
jgi:2Fe-2S ferredoxin